MPRWFRGPRAALLAALAGCVPQPVAYPGAGSPLASLERQYQAARYWDDRIRLAESLGSDTTPDGIPARVARDSLRHNATNLRARLDEAWVMLLSAEDARARATIAESPLVKPVDTTGTAAAAAATGAECGNGPASRPDGPESLADLTARTFACFTRAANTIVVDGDTLNRLAILGLLARTDDANRRGRLFRALEPVWRSVNGDNGPESPYRRLLALRRLAWADTASPIERKGPAFGLATEELEQWLVLALERWRAGMPDTPLEPWDWYYFAGEASRMLSPRIPAVADLRRVNDRYFQNFGADPSGLGIRYDLDARPGKYPVAFTDFGSRPRWTGGRLVPGEPWAFAGYLHGGLDNLAELLHETGHAIHIAAIRTRPAYVDWPDNDTFTEALADLPAMEVYEPAWQLRFLGDSAPLTSSLRARYAGIVFDMAWALFELRTHRAPGADPNSIWTDITRDYLGVRPHPEWSWWAMRGQLVDGPGYLINYALGAYVVADMRAAIRAARGTSVWSAPGMYDWLTQRLYRFGLERPSRQVLEDLLGRPLRPEALLADLDRLGS